jgi:para-aminobenzoate synthetase component 1
MPVASALIAPRTLRGLAPLDLLRRWPRDRALVMLHSGRVHQKWARLSILAPAQAWYVFDAQSRWIGDRPATLEKVELTDDPLRDVDAIIRAMSSDPREFGGNAPSFCGGWIGYFSYDLGRLIEPRAQHDPLRSTQQGQWPLIQLAWCPDALVFDHTTQSWHTIGDCASLVEQLEGKTACEDVDDRFTLGEIRAQIAPEQYMRMVRRTIDSIAAGDIFQANIAQPFIADFDGGTRALGRAAFELNNPWYGAYLEFESQDRQTLISLSPELFLQVDGQSRRVITRPIKGTRPATTSAGDLQHSDKDTAELNMIVDLMRNDLGRVCEIGSIQVANPRAIETHPTVHHGVGEVHGTLRGSISFADVLRATFPGGSVTGAPKIRAMQIIDELEHPHQRGPYCGAVGFISTCGNITLNIAIRTMLLHGESPVRGRAGSLVRGTLHYSAGAGIVADSIPQSEYQETLDKTAALRAIELKECESRSRDAS